MEIILLHAALRPRVISVAYPLRDAVHGVLVLLQPLNHPRRRVRVATFQRTPLGGGEQTLSDSTNREIASLVDCCLLSQVCQPSTQVDPLQAVERSLSLSDALLTLFKHLSPLERAVYVLCEGYEGKRKLHHLDEDDIDSAAEHRTRVDQFMPGITTGDFDEFIPSSAQMYG